jgi:arylsulfatase
VRYKNWKLYYEMSQSGAAGWLLPLIKYHFTLIQNIKRDPFEQFVTFDTSKTTMNFGGALGAPSTAFEYDFGILPFGQQLWLNELESYQKFPPLQAPETFNLDQVLAQIKAGTHGSQAGE